MSMTFFKKAKDYLPATSLKLMLHQQLSIMDEARPLSRLHASSLTASEGFCPRYYALHDVTKTKPKDQWLPTADNVTYQMGRDLQEQIVQALADSDHVIGHWVCAACGNKYVFCPRPKFCTKCQCKKFVADEVRFESAKSGASCGIDMLAKVGKQKLTICEIKTMARDQFKDLQAPMAEHRLRTNFYMRIVDESDSTWATLVDVHEARILYVCKGGYLADPELKAWGLKETYSPFKEYIVKRDDTKTEEYSKRAQVVTDFRKGLQGMPCGICTTSVSKRALQCSMRGVCFSGDHPPVYMWNETNAQHGS